MQKNKKPTKRQHYVPQVYLREFSQDQKRIYRYDIAKESQKNQPIPIDSVCYKKDLYEVINKADIKLSTNYVENVLATFEAIFSRHLKKIKNIVQSKPENKAVYFLDQDEKNFWASYTAIQLLRCPWSLKESFDCTKNLFKDYFELDYLQALSIMLCLPFSKNLMYEDETFFPNACKFFEKFVFGFRNR